VISDQLSVALFDNCSRFKQCQYQLFISGAIPQEDSLIAQHFYQLWLDNNVVSESIVLIGWRTLWNLSSVRVKNYTTKRF